MDQAPLSWVMTIYAVQSPGCCCSAARTRTLASGLAVLPMSVVVIVGTQLVP
jgi:hypothetical protein